MTGSTPTFDPARYKETLSQQWDNVAEGWLGAHVGLVPSTVRGYVRSMGLPAVRLRRHRVSSPALIDGWLLSVDRMKRKRLEPARAR